MVEQTPIPEEASRSWRRLSLRLAWLQGGVGRRLPQGLASSFHSEPWRPLPSYLSCCAHLITDARLLPREECSLGIGTTVRDQMRGQPLRMSSWPSSLTDKEQDTRKSLH